ncbi:heme-degrading domain-containing protein [Mesorhizobium sp.]|uniref:heme-degrading domain-containing protein n=1 Tax=Mesorhizobium sp. TaxID=1871066 RepID=UPI000FE8D776|nr:heme-degrading domain-containing protein [Mesorhizobium sp.]RWJ05736.1 MAG: heme-degrading domain-containing protein [Mesorhizobium sp.]
MPTDRDLEIVLEQERRVQFSSFDEEAAFSIGSAIRERGLAAGYALVIDIRLFDRKLFFAGLPGSTISLADWTRRKLNTVKVFHKSSYRIVLEKPRADRLFEPMHNLPASDYVVVGGAFPITLKGAGVVGAVAVAGAQMRDDHNMVVAAMCQHIGIGDGALVLPPLEE